MLIVCAYHKGDQVTAEKLAGWIVDLGGCKGHDLLLVADPTAADLRPKFRGFDSVTLIRSVPDAWHKWPESANMMFRTGGKHVEFAMPQHKYFLWLEPDTVPMAPKWADTLEQAFKVAVKEGKKFMGAKVDVENVPLHMSGVGIYPSPLSHFAGDIYQSYEIAWDVYAADKIIPQAEWTNLIQHAWKHPTFTDPHELETQIDKEAVLFHASKDGSLIELLKQKGGDASCEMISADQQSISRSNAAPKVQPSSAATYDIFVKTYPQDYRWLAYCLKAIKTFATGFRKIWVVSPEPWILVDPPEGVDWKVQNDETEDGYLAQQITKLYADVITDYSADYILNVDSDVIFTRPVKPEDFFKNGKLIWYYTPYDKIETPWQPITEKFMQKSQPYEFMRRLPMMVPRWLYPKLREFAHSVHGRPISEYIRSQPHRAFSEFNAMGAYAYAEHHDKFEWVSTVTNNIPPPFARQFHSWSGVTDKVKSEIDNILNTAPVLVEPQENPVTVTTEPASSGEARESTLSGGDHRESKAHQSSPSCEGKPDSRGGVQTTLVGMADMPSALGDTSGVKTATRVSEPRSCDGNAEQGLIASELRPEPDQSIGDHVRALAAYANNPWKRQYVIRQLKKENLVPKYRRKTK